MQPSSSLPPHPFHLSAHHPLLSGPVAFSLGSRLFHPRLSYIVCSPPGRQRDLLETSVRSHPSSAQKPLWLPSYFGQKPKTSPWPPSLNTPPPPPPHWGHASLSLKQPRHRPTPGPLHSLSLHSHMVLTLLPQGLDRAYRNGSEHGRLGHRLALRTGAMSPALFSCL